MKKPTITIIVLVVFLAFAVGLLVNSGKVERVEIPVGMANENDLGYSGFDYNTTTVGDDFGNEPLGSTTCYQILEENSGRLFAEIRLDPTFTEEVRLYFGTTTDGEAATSTYADSTKCWDLGMPITASTTASVGIYTIGPENLWKGEVWGNSFAESTTVWSMDK